MAEQLNLQVNVSGNATQSVQSLKKELREAQAQVAILSDKFGATSKEAVEAAKRAAELKDRIGDAKALTDAFNPDAKFKALTSSLQGVAGGFAAVQGAIGLFGGESKELEKQLLKVQSALALSQGLQSIGESIDSFKNLGTVIKNQVIPQIKALGTAAQIGIGLLIAAVGTAIVAWMDYVDTQEQVKKAQEETNKAIAEGAKTELTGATEALERERRLAIARLEGRKNNEKEIFETEQQFRRLKIKALERYYSELKNKDSKEAIDALNQIKSLNVDIQVEQIKQANKLAQIKKDAQDKEDQRIAALDAKAEAARIRIINFDNAEKERKKQQEDDDKKKQEKKDQDAEKNVQSIVDRAKKTVDGVMAQNNYLSWQEEQNRKKTEEREKAKQDAILLTGQAFGAVADLVGRETAAGKALASAQALINTYLGITQVLANDTTIPEPFGTIQKVAATATILASGLSALKNINKVQIPSKYGSGGSLSAPSTFAPVAPMGQTAQLTQLNQASINAIGNQAIRAYVVETDISASQKRIEAIKQKAKFG